MPHSLTDPSEPERRREMVGGLVEGRAVSIDADTGWVWVTIDRQPGLTPRGPCPFLSGVTPAPQPGDRVWAQEADSGRLVVLAWAAP